MKKIMPVSYKQPSLVFSQPLSSQIHTQNCLDSNSNFIPQSTHILKSSKTPDHCQKQSRPNYFSIQSLAGRQNQQKPISALNSHRPSKKNKHLIPVAIQPLKMSILSPTKYEQKNVKVSQVVKCSRVSEQFLDVADLLSAKRLIDSKSRYHDCETQQLNKTIGDKNWQTFIMQRRDGDDEEEVGTPPIESKEINKQRWIEASFFITIVLLIVKALLI